MPPYSSVLADPALALIERVARDPSADLDKLQRLLDLRAKAEMVPIVADAVNAEVGRAHRYASYAHLDRAVRPI